MKITHKALGRKSSTVKRTLLSTTKTPSHPTSYAVAKIILLGEARVGKTALAFCLAGGEFRKHPVNHPTQFWLLPASASPQSNDIHRDCVLWDLASQPDFRLIHPLSVTDADLTLLLFDPTERPNPLKQVEYWLTQLGGSTNHQHNAILVSTRSDVGGPALTRKEIEAFCRNKGIAGGFVATSAATGVGLPKLLKKIRSLLDWDQIGTISVPSDFDQLKNRVLSFAANPRKASCFPSIAQLNRRLASSGIGRIGVADFLKYMKLLEGYGYVRVLENGPAEARVLLAPKIFDALAASFVRQARKHERGLGALQEDLLVSSRYDFPELRGLSALQKHLLAQSVRLAFLEGRLAVRCQRELIGATRLLLFPELVTVKRPTEPDISSFLDDVSYRVTGEVESLFAIMVVSIGYTNTARSSEHWEKQAHYEIGENEICGFRQEGESDGEVTFVLYFDRKAQVSARTLFRGLFEGFLTRRKLTVILCEPAICKCGYVQDRAMVQERRREKKAFAFCSDCGKKLRLPNERKLVELEQQPESQFETESRVVQERTRFEAAVAQLYDRLKARKLRRPECFISYAWGVPDHESWVEKRLVADLQNAGIQIVYDRKDNQYGHSLTRFISRIPYCDSVVVVGTPLYFQKFENRLSSAGSVVAAEVNLISQRLIGTPEEHRTVKTLLLAGEKKTSLPPLMWDGIHADFRDDSVYFSTAFDLILSLYQLPKDDPAVADLRESLANRALT